MKKEKIILLVLALVLVTSQVALAARDSIKSTRETIAVNGQKKTVNVVTVDLKDPKISLDVAIANNKIGGHEDFSNIIKRKKPIAAINANYFDAYKTLEPIGSIMTDGKLSYLESSPASLIVMEDGKVDIGKYKMTIKGYLNGKRKNDWIEETQKMKFNLFDIWYVNNIPKDPTGVYLYTPLRGDKIELKGGIAVVVVKDKVDKIIKNAGETVIPKDGYIIYYGNVKSFEEYVDVRFKKGDTVELEYIVSRQAYNKEKKSPENTKTEPKKKLSSKQTKLFGSINRKLENYWSNEKNRMEFNLFNIWYINSDPIHPKGVYLYTPEKGESVDVEGGHSITVENGKVSKVLYDIKNVDIPKDGFAIYFEEKAKRNYIKARFEIGDRVDFYHKSTFKFDTDNIIKKAVADNESAIQKKTSKKSQAEKPLDLKKNNIKSVISAGPYLVEDGKVIFDKDKNGFKEDKITKNRAQRSAIGITKEDKLILVTGSNINMTELSAIMVKLGADKAMNLDGGASSALYANGKTITPAGRKLNTVLTIFK